MERSEDSLSLGNSRIGRFQLVTKASQDAYFYSACEDLLLIGAGHRRRLLAALSYFHTGCRLLRESKGPGEFLAESLLNFCKVLDTLFPAKNENQARDQARAGLAALGLNKDVIERDMMPIMILRSMFDVAHPTLALLTLTQAETLQRYAERAEIVLCDLLRVVISRVRSGEYEVAQYTHQKLSSQAAQTIERLKARLDEIERLPGGRERFAMRIRRSPIAATASDASQVVDE